LLPCIWWIKNIFIVSLGHFLYTTVSSCPRLPDTPSLLGPPAKPAVSLPQWDTVVGILQLIYNSARLSLHFTVRFFLACVFCVAIEPPQGYRTAVSNSLLSFVAGETVRRYYMPIAHTSSCPLSTCFYEYLIPNSDWRLVFNCRRVHLGHCTFFNDVLCA